MKQRKRDKPWLSPGGGDLDYTLRSDETALDSFIISLTQFLSTEPLKIQVSGLTGWPKKHNHICFKEMEQQPPLDGWFKRYWVRLLVKPEDWGLTDILPSDVWAKGYDDALRKVLYEEARKRVHEKLEPFLAMQVGRFGLAVSLGSYHYVTIGMELPITSYDVLVHRFSNLTEFGEQHIREVARASDKILKRNNLGISELYVDDELKDRLFRRAENVVREQLGVSKVGDSYVNETLLFSLVKEKFPNAKREHSPSWLKPQRFDIYIPRKKIAIEYHGQQHYEPVEHFGGVEAFRRNQERDARKCELAKKHKVKLVEWPYTKPVTRETVDEMLSFVQRDSRKKPL